MKKMEKVYLESVYEELAMETVEEKEEIITLEKFGKYSSMKIAKERATELELEILAIERGEF